MDADEGSKDGLLSGMTEALHLSPSRNLPGVKAAAVVEDEEAELGIGLRLGRGLLACIYVAVLLAVLLAATFPLAMVIAWRMVPGSFREVQPLHFDYRTAQPTAEAWLLPPPALAKAAAQAASRPGKPAGPHLLPRGQPYRVTLELTLPESDHNRQLGMFQVSAEALAVDGAVLARASVPCMLKWRSRPVRYARLAVLALPLLAGLLEEHQRLRLPLLRAVEGLRPLAAVRLLLEPKAGLPPPVGLPELYAAQVTVESAPAGLWGWLRFWRLTSVVWALVGLLGAELGLLLLCCHRALLPRLWGGRPLPALPRDVAVAHHLAAAAETVAAQEGGKGEAEPPSLEVSDLEEEEEEEEEGFLPSPQERRGRAAGASDGLRRRHPALAEGWEEGAEGSCGEGLSRTGEGVAVTAREGGGGEDSGWAEVEAPTDSWDGPEGGSRGGEALWGRSRAKELEVGLRAVAEAPSCVGVATERAIREELLRGPLERAALEVGQLGEAGRQGLGLLERAADLAPTLGMTGETHGERGGGGEGAGEQWAGRACSPWDPLLPDAAESEWQQAPRSGQAALGGHGPGVRYPQVSGEWEDEETAPRGAQGACRPTS